VGDVDAQSPTDVDGRFCGRRGGPATGVGLKQVGRFSDAPVALQECILVSCKATGINILYKYLISRLLN
jgi:hypothetical protein